MNNRYTAEGIILGVRNFGEADKIVTLFTREQGLVRATAFGSRRPKSPLAGSVQMFNHVEVTLIEGRNIDTLRECVLKGYWRPLQEDLTAMAYGSFVAELVRELFPEKAAEPDLLERLLLIFPALAAHSPRLVALAAAYQLFTIAGFAPHYFDCARCGRDISGLAAFSYHEGGVLCENCVPLKFSLPYPTAVRCLIEKLLGLDWQDPAPFKAGKAELIQAEKIILVSLYAVLDKPLRSLEFIRQLP